MFVFVLLGFLLFDFIVLGYTVKSSIMDDPEAYVRELLEDRLTYAKKKGDLCAASRIAKAIVAFDLDDPLEDVFTKKFLEVYFTVLED